MLGWLYRQIAPDAVEGGAPFGRFEAGVLVVAAIGLTITQFVGSETVFLDLFGDALKADVVERMTAAGDPIGASLAYTRDHPLYDLLALFHWVAFCVIGYVLVPAIWFKVNGRSVIESGYMGLRGFTGHLGVYGALAGIMAVVVVIASFMPANQAIYPFYRFAGRSWADLIAWELAYGVQFFALEFLFRGALLDGLRRWAGYGAVFIMVIPYCMLHFQKTGTESLAAIVAGVVLGCLSMKYRSIWGGVLLHWGVAISMDVLSMLHQDELPTTLWPPGF